MKIISIELVGYKRLALNNINRIKLTPESKIQFILGTNGSGKSSLLKELSPLPAIANEFSKGGYKEIIIEHRSSTFILLSDFRSNKSYSFIKDGREINPSSTITVYKELVESEFNITQDIHNLMIGSTGFHSMSVMERRNWFTKICDSDYTYAIRFYNKLKERHRDLLGGTKLSRVRLVQESDKLLSEEDTVKLKSKLDGLNLLRQDLLSLKTTIPDKSSILSTISSSYDSIMSLVDTTTTLMNDVKLGEVDNLKLNLLVVQLEIQRLKGVSEIIYEELKENRIIQDILSKGNIDGSGDLDKNIDELSSSINTLEKGLYLNLPITDSEAINVIDTIRPDLINICSIIPVNINSDFTRERQIDLDEKLTLLKIEYRKLDGEQNRDTKLKSELEHLKIHNQVDCPKCKFRWAMGYDDSKYNHIISSITTRESRLVTISKDITAITNTLKELSDYFDNLRSLKQIMSLYSILKPYWNYVINKEYVFKSPSRIVDDLVILRDDLLIMLKMNKLTDELKSVKQLKCKLLEDNITSVRNINQQVDTLESSLHRNNNAISESQVKYNELENQLANTISLEESISRLTRLAKSTYRNERKLKVIKTQETLNDLINEVTVAISQLELKLSKVDSQIAIVKSMTDNLLELENEEKLIKLAVRELSPSEGLIAKGLNGFINFFIYELNQFIKSIWLYPLELIPSDGDSVDLDFKFNVKINDDHIINDVKLGSSAMKEIIDLAFRVVSAKYLNLGNAPLFLDEFGVKLDKSHRDSAFYAINEILTHSEFTQVFMISHYSSNYGSFKNADITILSESNIEIPRDLSFNKKVEIS